MPKWSREVQDMLGYLAMMKSIANDNFSDNIACSTCLR
jgi:hypothetical protein